MSIDGKHTQLKHPFTALVAGPSGSGKTHLVRRLLEHHGRLISGTKGHVLRVVWAYGQHQDLYRVKVPNCTIQYVDGLPDSSMIESSAAELIVIDDLMSELANNPKLSSLFTKGSHHRSISVIFITQNIFHQGKQMRDVSLNTKYIIMTKNVRDRQQLATLARQIFPGKTKFFLEAFDDATRHPYGYLLLDLTPTTPDELRVRTRITPEEHSPISPIIYTAR